MYFVRLLSLIIFSAAVSGQANPMPRSTSRIIKDYRQGRMLTKTTTLAAIGASVYLWEKNEQEKREQEKKFIDITKGNNEFLLSCKNGDLEVADLIRKNQPLLLLAVKQNNILLVQYLLEHPNINVNMVANGQCALSIAISMENIEMVTLLLSHKNIITYTKCITLALSKTSHQISKMVNQHRCEKLITSLHEFASKE